MARYRKWTIYYDPTDPSQIVNPRTGTIDCNDMSRFAQENNLPNTWSSDPNKFSDGDFKYNSSDGNYNYTTWGHGSNSNAPVGSNAANGPTTSMTRHSTNGGSKQYYRTDGTWGTFGSDKNGAHIPTTNSPYS